MRLETPEVLEKSTDNLPMIRRNLPIHPHAAAANRQIIVRSKPAIDRGFPEIVRFIQQSQTTFPESLNLRP